MKRGRTLILTLGIGSITGLLKAQDPIIMTINDKQIKKSEFEAVYNKNSGKESSANNKSVKEYVDLFSLFKSKVLEAEYLGLDTVATFKAELAGYRRQLAAPYLTDKNTNDNLLTEAYNRIKNEVKASHILIKVDDNALPKDTLEAWTRINLIRNAILGKFPQATEIASYEKLLKGSSEVTKQLKAKDSTLYKSRLAAVKGLQENSKQGTDAFIAIAPKTSDDPSVADNKGDLNYFSAFDMVYPFESVAFNTKVGDISSIVRTRFGYHILKVYDKRAARGEIFVSHIMIKFPKNANESDKANAKTKVDEIYAKIKAGQNFEELAKQFSDDKQSNERGGQMQPFKGGRLPKVFEDAAFALKNDGDISEPVQSPYGWHIIKRNSLKPIMTFDEMKNELKTKVTRDSRSQMGKVALIERVKKENNFKETLKNRDELLKVMDTTFFKATWKAESAAKLGNKEIFNLAGKSYTQNDFAKFLESQMTFKPSDSNLQKSLLDIYKTWVEETVVNYEDSQLEKKHIEFANLYREYRDGILLFDLTDQKVWSKAVKDTAGLRVYYEKNKNNYLWEERADVTIYKCLNDKVSKEVRKLLKSNKDEKSIVDAVNKSSQLNLMVENITYLKGENKLVDENWKTGIATKDYKDEKENKVLVITVNKILPKSPKTLGECRGALTADYQSSLDTEWISYLKNKYKVKVNEEVLNTIK